MCHHYLLLRHNFNKVTFSTRDFGTHIEVSGTHIEVSHPASRALVPRMASRCPMATGASFFSFLHSNFQFPIPQFFADDTATLGDFRSGFTSISFYYTIIHILLVLEFGLTHVTPHGATCLRLLPKT